MSHAALNQFFGVMLIVSIFGALILGRILAAYVLWWKPTTDTTQTQRKRYVAAGTCILGTTVSLAFLLSHYSPSQIRLGLKGLNIAWSYEFLLVLALYILTIVLSVVFVVHSYRKPTRYAKYIRSKFTGERMLMPTINIRCARHAAWSSRWRRITAKRV